MRKAMIFILAMAGSWLMAQDPVAGTVSFTVKTVSNGATFSPKHVLAIWVEDGSGQFVKTLKLNADKRKQYLYTWNNKSGGNTVDATTGATLSSHITHSVSWDCTNTSHQLVADGNYAMAIEYTSEHAQGPKTTVAFTKSADGFQVTPADLSYFINMDLVFTPENGSTGIENTGIQSELARVYPNPAREDINLEWNAPESGPVEILIYDSSVRLAGVLFNQEGQAGKNSFTANLDPALSSGNYYIVFKGKTWYAARRITVLR